MCVFSSIIALLITTGTLLTAYQFTEDHEKDIIIFPPTDNELTSVENHEIIDRLQWGGKPPANSTRPLDHPVELVIVAHTVTSFCSTVQHCSRIVVAVQNYHLHLGLSDVTYNFLIGGDGNIYVGRGWDINNGIKNQSIAISLIGNYMHDTLNDQMTDALHVLLDQGVILGKLKQNYKIVCHNQVRATLSPGTKACSTLKTFDHYSPEKIS